MLTFRTFWRYIFSVAFLWACTYGCENVRVHTGNTPSILYNFPKQRQGDEEVAQTGCSENPTQISESFDQTKNSTNVRMRNPRKLVIRKQLVTTQGYSVTQRDLCKENYFSERIPSLQVPVSKGLKFMKHAFKLEDSRNKRERTKKNYVIPWFGSAVPLEIHFTIRIVEGASFTPLLADPTSGAFMNLARRVQAMVDSIYRASPLAALYLSSRVVKFRKGSVVSELSASFTTHPGVDGISTIVSKTISANGSSYAGLVMGSMTSAPLGITLSTGPARTSAILKASTDTVNRELQSLPLTTATPSASHTWNSSSPLQSVQKEMSLNVSSVISAGIFSALHSPSPATSTRSVGFHASSSGGVQEVNAKNVPSSVTAVTNSIVVGMSGNDSVSFVAPKTTVSIAPIPSQTLHLSVNKTTRSTKDGQSLVLGSSHAVNPSSTASNFESKSSSGPLAKNVSSGKTSQFFSSTPGAPNLTSVNVVGGSDTLVASVINPIQTSGSQMLPTIAASAIATGNQNSTKSSGGQKLSSEIQNTSRNLVTSQIIQSSVLFITSGTPGGVKRSPTISSSSNMSTKAMPSKSKETVHTFSLGTNFHNRSAQSAVVRLSVSSLDSSVKESQGTNQVYIPSSSLKITAFSSDAQRSATIQALGTVSLGITQKNTSASTNISPVSRATTQTSRLTKTPGGTASPSFTLGAKQISSNQRETIASANATQLRSSSGISPGVFHGSVKSVTTSFVAQNRTPVVSPVATSHEAIQRSSNLPGVTSAMGTSAPPVSRGSQVLWTSNAPVYTSMAIEKQITSVASPVIPLSSNGAIDASSVLPAGSKNSSLITKTASLRPSDATRLSPSPKQTSMPPARTSSTATVVLVHGASPTSNSSMPQVSSVEQALSPGPSIQITPSASYSSASSPSLPMHNSATLSSTVETSRGFHSTAFSKATTALPSATADITNQTRTVNVTSILGSSTKHVVASSSAVPTDTPSRSGGTREIKVEATIVNETFNRDLLNESSSQFQALFTKVNKSLTEVYSTLEGFQKVDIKGFSNGSVKVDFNVILNSTSNATLNQVTQQLAQAKNISFSGVSAKELCTASYCLNSGTCENKAVGATCRCAAGYRGSRCHESDGSLNGGYSAWSEFSKCSKTCGAGQKSRRRTCNNPSPKGVGRNCTSLGPSVEYKECNEESCTETDWKGIIIGVCCGVVFLVIVLLVIFLLCRRRRKSKSSSQSLHTNGLNGSTLVPLEIIEKVHTEPRVPPDGHDNPEFIKDKDDDDDDIYKAQLLLFLKQSHLINPETQHDDEADTSRAPSRKASGMSVENNGPNGGEAMISEEPEPNSTPALVDGNSRKDLPQQTTTLW